LTREGADVSLNAETPAAVAPSSATEIPFVDLNDEEVEASSSSLSTVGRGTSGASVSSAGPPPDAPISSVPRGLVPIDGEHDVLFNDVMALDVRRGAEVKARLARLNDANDLARIRCIDEWGLCFPGEFQVSLGLCSGPLSLPVKKPDSDSEDSPDDGSSDGSPLMTTDGNGNFEVE
jgi:hypothetical protein